MNRKMVVRKTAAYVKKKLGGEGSGHDWWHIYRVWKNAKQIGRHEKVDMFVVELASLLHDIADWKLYGGDESVGPKTAARWLRKINVDRDVIDQVSTIIRDLSFKGAKTKIKKMSPEGAVVQDADRLDAIGAIGIARAFAYGGYKNREIHNPDINPTLHQTFASYKSNKGTTINHFYEKLLLLKNRMNTKTAKRIAANRHHYMVQYLNQFFQEWAGKK